MYDVRVTKIGYRVEQNRVLDLSTQPSATAAFALQKAAVLWSDLSIYQGIVLLPDLPGKRMLLTDGTTPIRDAPCAICHSFQKKMAPWVRNEAAWRSRLEFMKTSMNCCSGGNQKMTVQEENDIVSYLTAVFGPNSVLPATPADDPRYKNTVHPISDDALNIVYVEYELPGPDRMPWSAVPDGKGNVWLPYKSDQNKIARVKIDTGEVTEYRVPHKGVAQVHSVFPAPDGSVWLAESNGPNKLGRWDPKTEQITEYQDTGSKHTVRVRQDGLVCSSNLLTLFDPKTNEYTHFAGNPTAYGVVFDNDGNCWFTQYGKSGKIGKIDVKTKEVKMWTTPTAAAGRFVYARRIQVDKAGIVWFDESEANQIGRFDPKTETFKEFALPGPMATPYAMNLDKDGFVWYSSEYMDVYGRMDPNTGKTIEYPFPHSENFSREFFLDDQGRNWYATPSNNKVGYFYLAGTDYHAKYFAHELTKRCPSDSAEKLAGALVDAQVDLNPHQVEAALFAFRSPLSRGALLADEVGLGKTIEAGLVISQRWAERKRRILIITPSNLRKQWHQELSEKFFLPCRILESRFYNEAVAQGNFRPFEGNDTIVICSYQFARSKAADVANTPWHLVVIDEAHRLRNVYKPSNVIANTLKLALKDAPKLLLTATPLQNSLLELFGLVSFVDEYAFGDLASFRAQFTHLTNQEMFDTLKARLRPMCHRTLRRQVTAYVPFTRRHPMVQPFTPEESEDRLYHLVSNYLRRDNLQASAKEPAVIDDARPAQAAGVFVIRHRGCAWNAWQPIEGPSPARDAEAAGEQSSRKTTKRSMRRPTNGPKTNRSPSRCRTPTAPLWNRKLPTSKGSEPWRCRSRATRKAGRCSLRSIMRLARPNGWAPRGRPSSLLSPGAPRNTCCASSPTAPIPPGSSSSTARTATRARARSTRRGWSATKARTA